MKAAFELEWMGGPAEHHFRKARPGVDDMAWGKSQNLFVFFTEAATGKKYRLSVFHNKQYHPSKEGPAFDEEPVGSSFEITTGKSKSGLPSFLSARKL